MVVDDEATTLDIFEKYLKAQGFSVDAFTDPVKALYHFKQNAGSYSLLLTDIRMPKMTGIQLTQEILRIRPDIKFILMTAFQLEFPELQIIKPPQSEESDILLRKPFDLDEMCQAIKKQLQLK